ncbi:MAG: CinA family protein [Anaerolineales bacterium]
MDEKLEERAGSALTVKGWTLALAESCTGGLIAHRITDVPGSSDYFLGGIVAYSNAVKESLLSVSNGTLQAVGAVSEETAQEMAQGARQTIGSDVGLSVTGIAGPGGGTGEKPVGLTFIGISTPEGEWVERHVFQGDRQSIKKSAAEAALNLLLTALEGNASRPA